MRKKNCVDNAKKRPNVKLKEKGISQEKLSKKRSKTTNEVRHHNPLSVKPLLFHDDAAICSFLKCKKPNAGHDCSDLSLPQIIKSVENRLEGLKTKIQKKEDNEFIDELRLYKRGIRRRTLGAESERSEKEKFCAEYENERLIYKYENRTKKKSLSDIEIDALVTKPIVFVPGSSEEPNIPISCNIENCKLCGTHFAHVIMLKEQVDNINITCNESTTVINNPLFREINESIPDNREEVRCNKSSSCQITENQSKRSVYLHTEDESMKLIEMKDSLHFVKKYNEGLLKN